MSLYTQQLLAGHPAHDRFPPPPVVSISVILAFLWTFAAHRDVLRLNTGQRSVHCFPQAFLPEILEDFLVSLDISGMVSDTPSWSPSGLN